MENEDVSNSNVFLMGSWNDWSSGLELTSANNVYSGVADSGTRTVSWTSGNGTIVIEQEDGGGGITALGKVPGYMIVFKRWTMKRWNGSSTFPEDLVNQGTFSQESICYGRGSILFPNENGIWLTNGTYPKKIS